MRSLLLLAVLATLSIGCTPSSKGPTLDPDQFPNALANLETQCNEIVAAFEAGDPKAADRPLHMLGRVYSSIKQLAEPAGLDATQRADLEKATDEVFDALGELHEPLHKPEFPEDFDFEPIHEKLEEGLAHVREALPAAIVEKMDAIVAKSAPSQEAEDDADHDHEDGDHADHDHEDGDHEDDDEGHDGEDHDHEEGEEHADE